MRGTGGVTTTGRPRWWAALRRTSVLAWVVVVGTVLVGCGQASQTASPAPASPTVTAPAATATPRGPVTIQVWGSSFDMESGERLLNAYTIQHPEVTFEITLQTDVPTVAKVGLESASLDLLVHDTGLNTTNLWAEAGLLLPLDAYWEQYGWDDRITAYGKAGATYDGKVYGITNEVSFLAMVYRTSVFEQHNLSVPTTYAEWLATLETLKQAGEVPLEAGLRGGAQSGHLFGQFLQAALGRDGIEALLFGDGKWTDPAVLEATTRMLDVIRAGYLDKDAQALDFNEASARFLTGGAAIHMNGVWGIQAATEAFGESGFDFMTLPPWDSSVTPNYGGGLGSQWSIAATSEHADVIAEFFDFMYSDEGLRIWVEENKLFPPVNADFAAFAITSQQRKMADLIAQADEGVISYWIGPNLPADARPVFAQGVAGVALEQVTPEAWLNDMQTAVDAAR